jgi:ribonuclease HII
MVRAAEDHPVYRFDRNKGYPAPVHVAALAEHGPCVLHRHSWAPLVALAQPTLPGMRT